MNTISNRTPFILQFARSYARSSKSTRTRPSAVQAQSQEQAVAVTEWTEVKDEASGQVYYWNQATNETTALGEPKPGREGRVANYQQPDQTLGPQQSLGQSLGSGLAFGAGAGAAHAIVGGIAGSLFGGE
mmetsp:Transcript_7674/g.10358  ORF Transcript_7674/g.10358 Transcript_7674/m.10358 type:complete len:130 (-) Transcript_7674:356-745(-)|eukprot:CAMPEP_0196589338 /NCGR_PEP_ID=MMETSP1081-20130531/63267_1 /TAXON_ID=36882 /ORGANISM="Pyramimonas amylifera, Strain CCMP720" /LENGTH=129 /DNA_ID=CAMNT_0041912107 /DNA_START=98 /DNA_END=487 /DNA_ORIENTATION=-